MTHTSVFAPPYHAYYGSLIYGYTILHMIYFFIAVIVAIMFFQCTNPIKVRPKLHLT